MANTSKISSFFRFLAGFMILSGSAFFVYADTHSFEVEKALDEYEQKILEERNSHPSVQGQEIASEGPDYNYDWINAAGDENNPPAPEQVQEDPEPAMESREEPPLDTAPSNEPLQFGESETFEDVDETAMIDSLELKNMDIADVLKLLSEKSGLNIVAGRNVSGKATIYLRNVKLKDALHIILDVNDLAYKMEHGIVRVMRAQEFEERYGHVYGGEIKTRIVQLKHIDITDVEAVLNQMKSSKGKIIADSKTSMLVMMDSLDKLRMMEVLVQKMDSPIETKIFELKYAMAKEISEKITENLTPNVGKIKFDERSNKIVVMDIPAKIKEISNMIQAFDTKEKQVLIEAKIIQVVLSNQHKFGVDWEAIVNQYHNLDMTSDFDILESSDKRGTLSIGTIAGDDYTFLIEALEEEGETKILSSPSITSLNNKEAKILVGSNEPYVTTTTTTPSSGPTTTAESVEFIDVGVKLYVTPTIHKDGFITMTIKPEISSVTQTLRTSNNNTIPIVETSEAETTVMVKDGVTIVIGGLIKDEKIASRNKVPFLGDIPIVGNVFRNNDDLSRKTEIVIFLTPKIISGDVSRVPRSRISSTQ